MISIIVSSYKEDFFNKFERNVETTIGVEYQIVKIHNPNRIGISEAYNTGVSKAKYEIVLFCHEDVIFWSDNWGNELIRLFNSDVKIGLIGLAGAKVKSYVASGWHTKNEDFLVYNYIQSDYKNEISKYSMVNIDATTEVAAIDGFFMASIKEILLKNPFDSTLLAGFHGYDLDISLSIGQHYKIVVSHLIKAEHLSLGSFETMWFKEILKVNEKYKSILPVYTNGIIKNKKVEYDSLAFLFNFIKTNEIDSPKTFELLRKYYRNIGFFNLIKINIYWVFISLRKFLLIR